jgi:4-hydroxyphenylacetate 3-monooxygenase
MNPKTLESVVSPPESAALLRNGSRFKQSLRDGRAVWANGERVEDVTTHPALGPGIDMIAECFDAQFDPKFQDVLTFIDDDGQRVSRSWQLPRTHEDLLNRRRLIEYTTLKTAGTFGRPFDLAPLIAVGLVAHQGKFRQARQNPEFAEQNADFARNISAYIDFGRRNNIIAAEVLADPQADRSADPSKSPGLLRVVRKAANGVWLRGAKSVGSIAAQADEIIFSNLLKPNFPPEGCVWAAIPVATEGLKLVCREQVSRPDADPYDHPLASRGEESDQLLIFDDVFVPNERLFNVGEPELLKLYGPVVLWVHWHILSRLWYKAELFVGAAQLVIDVLGTGHIAGVRSYMAELISYAETLKAFVLAAENQAAMTEGGVLSPNVNLLTAGRLHSIENYPRIIHVLQELCGQGLVMRFQKAAFDDPEIGPLLDQFLPGRNMNARDKNRLMNFVWDLTTDSLAGRTELFENVNATPANFLRERLFNEYPRDKVVGIARDLAGL